MQVLIAEHAGSCYGVERALRLANQALENGCKTTSLGPLIHNPQVVHKLQQRGLSIAENVSDISDGTVLIRSHGVTAAVRNEIDERGLSCIDATCPYVTRAQRAAKELGETEKCVVVLGENGHPEVEGLRSYAQCSCDKVYVVSGVDELPCDLPHHVGVVVQTTQREEQLHALTDALRTRGVVLDVRDTICHATRDRQQAAAKLAAEVDAMVIIGGHNSSNTTRLCDLCRGLNNRTFGIETIDELSPEMFEGCQSIGISAGASTPEAQIVPVVEYLRSMDA